MYHFPSENNKKLDQLQRQLRDEEASHDNTRKEHQKLKDELTDAKKRTEDTEDKLAGKSHWKYDIV